GRGRMRQPFHARRPQALQVTAELPGHLFRRQRFFGHDTLLAGDTLSPLRFPYNYLRWVLARTRPLPGQRLFMMAVIPNSFTLGLVQMRCEAEPQVNLEHAVEALHQA